MRSLFLILSVLSAATLLHAQMPAPVVVPAASPAAPATAPANPPAASAGVASAIKTLEAIKAANDETLRKQQATLQALEAVEKDAEQIKIFSKRS